MSDSPTPSPSPSPPLPPLPPGPRQLLTVPPATPTPAPPTPQPLAPTTPPTAYPDVFAELDKLQHKQGSWVNGVLLLVVSLVAFGAVGFTQWKWNWKTLALVVGVLLFHELGHYAAMRLFGYRNLKMLFIPFFGAAVIGRHYNVAGWKKAVVSLMGPVPGILLGIGVGVAGIVLGKPALYPAAGILLALNAFNLLPVLPLDGGWVMHTLYFSRSTVLDVIFRCLAAGALVLLGFIGGGKFLLILGGFMALGIPMAAKLARITQDLRRYGVPPASDDGQTIPPAVAEAIIGRVKAAFPRGLTPKGVAQHTLNVFETLNARPPGWGATFGLTAVHGASFLAALVFGVVLYIANHPGGFRGFFSQLAESAELPHVLDAGAAKTARSRDPAGSGAVRADGTVVATFGRQRQAADAFDDLAPRLPAGGAVGLFGKSVLLSPPPEMDAAAVATWTTDLSGRAGATAFIDAPSTRATLTMTCVARDAAEAEAIRAEVTEFTGSPGEGLLVPPWQPAEEDPRTPQQRAAHRLARRTYAVIQRVALEALLSDAPQGLSKQMADAAARKDTAELEKLQPQCRQVVRAARAEKIRRIRDGGDAKADGPVDVELVDQYLALVQAAERRADAAAERPAGGAASGRAAPSGATAPASRPATPQALPFPDRAAIVRVLGPRMGQLPLEPADTSPGTTGERRPLPGVDRYVTRSGWVSAEGVVLRFDLVTFASLADGAPALARWLQSKGCSVFRYDLQPMNMAAGFADEELELDEEEGDEE